MTILAVAAGFAADLAFGDPRWLPHPVVAMGRAITWAEGRLRGAFPQTSAGTRAATRPPFENARATARLWRRNSHAARI